MICLSLSFYSTIFRYAVKAVYGASIIDTVIINHDITNNHDLVEVEMNKFVRGDEYMFAVSCHLETEPCHEPAPHTWRYFPCLSMLILHVVNWMLDVSHIAN